MLYEWLAADSGIFNVLNYITFRSGAAVVTAFLVTVLFGDTIINFLRARQGKGQPIRDLSLEAQLSKQGTPTMGGFLIWLGLVVGVLLWGNLTNPYIWVTSQSGLVCQNEIKTNSVSSFMNFMILCMTM